MVMVVVASAFGYGWIVHEESRTGGMGEKWEMPVSDSYQTDLSVIQPDGALLFTDNEHHIISLVDRDGAVEWSHPYGAVLLYSRIVGDNLYFINVSEGGQYALNCIGMDGVWKSTTPCPPIFYFSYGCDGRIYATGEVKNDTTLYCIEGGSVKWSYTQNGTVIVSNVWSDGRVLIRYTNERPEWVNSSYDMVLKADEMVMLSANGTSQWTQPFPLGDISTSSSSAKVASDGTIMLIHQDLLEKRTQGYSMDGSLLWTDNNTYDPNYQTAIYYGCQSWGLSSQQTYIEHVYKVDPLNNSNSWNIFLNDTMSGEMYDLKGMEIFIAGDGQGYGIDPNGSILWHIQTGTAETQQCEVNDSLGLLLLSDGSLVKIDKSGSFWVYEGFDNQVMGAVLGPNNTVYVLTESKLVVLYKPTVSAPSEYLMAMISVDLLVTLSAGLWIADRLVKKPN